VVLAWACRAAGREAQADEIWHQVVARNPSYESMATADLTRRFERILDSEGPPLHEWDEPGNVEPAAAHIARAEALAGESKLDEAIFELGRAASLDPVDARVHLLMARLYRERGDTEKALASFHMSLFSRDDEAVRLEMDGLTSPPIP